MPLAISEMPSKDGCFGVYNKNIVYSFRSKEREDEIVIPHFTIRGMANHD